MRKNAKTRSKNNKISFLNPLIRQKEKELERFNKKHSMEVDSYKFATNDTTIRDYTRANRNMNISSRMDKCSNISSGYGDIMKMLKKNSKKNRIQSAHPIKQYDYLKKNNSNLTTSFTYNQKQNSDNDTTKEEVKTLIDI